MSEPAVTQSELEWCARQWAMIRDGGVWGIPRSGLILVKREASRTFAVTARMPLMPGMVTFEGEPLTAEQLREQQDAEIAGLRARFERVGIQVVDETEDA